MFCGNLVHFSRVGILYKKTSGNAVAINEEKRASQYPRKRKLAKRKSG
jgi:hypothetical protein